MAWWAFCMRKIPARYRTALVVLFDLLAVPVAWYGAFWARFNLEFGPAFEHAVPSLWLLLLGLMGVQLAVCRGVGLHRGMWSFASLLDLQRVIYATAANLVFLLLVITFFPYEISVPRSVVVLYPLLLASLMSGARLGWRMLRDRTFSPTRVRGVPVIIVGAGTAGMMLLRELIRTHDWHVVALVDDDPHKRGLQLLGRSVEGGVKDIPALLKKHETQHLILAMPSAQPETLQRVNQMATQAGAQLYSVPGLHELMGGRVAINAMRPVRVEDLLGREAVQIDTEHVQQMLSGQRLLVSGAGGSIGSELCRQLSRFDPACIILVEVSEYALYKIDSWFQEMRPEVQVIPLAADVRDAVRMRQIFAQYRPDVVFHAAAYKHVPLMEVGNAWQALRNNVVGTFVMAREAVRHRCQRFVLISTDKAVNPTNVMGATKRMAEMVCQAMQSEGGQTKFQMVRFGNVLGSTGSVIPKFREQIASGGPVTVTHPEVTRYFMSIPEAAQLVLQAAAMGEGGEIFVLDMGEPVQILQLAKNMIHLGGYSEEEIKIVFTGLRPGEKMYEELLADAEQTVQTPHPKLRIARARPADAALIREVQYWLDEALSYSDAQVRALLKQWVTEYAPSVLPLDDERAGSTKAIRSADVEVEGAVRP